MGYNLPITTQQNSAGSMQLNRPKLTTPVETMQGGMGGMNLMSLFQPITQGQEYTQRMSGYHGGDLMNLLKSYSSAEKPRFKGNWLKTGDLWKY